MAANKKKNLCTVLVKAILCLIIGPLTLTSFVFAAEPIQSYDRQSIRYPSMYTGQIWAKIGAKPSPKLDMAERNSSTKRGDPSPEADMEKGNASAGIGADKKWVANKDEGNTSSSLNKDTKIQKNEATQNTEIKKRLKKKISQKVKTQNNKGSQPTAVNNKPLTPKTDVKESSSKPANKSVRQEKNVLAGGKTIEIAKADKPVKNWHHKQELFDIDCSEKLARVVVTYYFDRRETVLKSSQTPDAQWYHIYPGSFEEQLYIEICNPHL